VPKEGHTLRKKEKRGAYLVHRGKKKGGGMVGVWGGGKLSVPLVADAKKGKKRPKHKGKRLIVPTYWC